MKKLLILSTLSHYSTPSHSKLTYATYVQWKLDYLYTSSKNLHPSSDNSGYQWHKIIQEAILNSIFSFCNKNI